MPEKLIFYVAVVPNIISLWAPFSYRDVVAAIIFGIILQLNLK